MIFAAASFTDFLDGYLARRYAVQSRFGRLADPLADRLLIDVALILLVWHDRLPWWLALPVLLRDVLLGIVFKLRHEATTVQVNFTGKTATARDHGVADPAHADQRRLARVRVRARASCWQSARRVMYLRSPQGGLESKPS